MPNFHYRVAIPEPTAHLLQLELQVTDWQGGVLDWKLPVWSVGSYLVREYSKHIVAFSANCPVVKLAKNHWQLQPTSNSIVINYSVYANELTVRTNHVDATHAFFNSGAVFGFIEGYLAEPYRIEIVLPYPHWQIATALPPIVNTTNSFCAPNYHVLADSPFEIGLHRKYIFDVLGKTHELVIWGEGNIQPETTITDIRKIIETEAEFWGSLPYDRYLFILHLSTGGYGGLEHRDCCVLLYDRWGFRGDAYLKFLNLVAHEFFHTWNVKRLRPASLFQINYEQENYTHSLWLCEGITSYYDQLLVLRAGLCDCNQYFQQISEAITRLQTTIGRKYQSLWESSFDAWIKLYRPDSNSHNAQVSYYLKGELVALLLDLHIRLHSANKFTLDDIMRALWQRYGIPAQPYDDMEVLALMEQITGVELQSFWQKYLFGTAELDYEYYFQPFGLELQAQSTRNIPYTGLQFRTQNGTLLVKSVDLHSPAQRAGIDANDEIIALNRRKVSLESIYNRLSECAPGTTVELTIFHQDELRHTQVELAPAQADRYVVQVLDKPTPEQLERLNQWLGLSTGSLSKRDS
ncbi:MAG: M61 family metallopeptidase [Pseudanabaenaceae cyanobacterium]